MMDTMFDCLLVQLLFSFSTPLNKFLLNHTTFIGLIVWRTGVAGLMMALIVLVSRKRLPHLTNFHILRLLGYKIVLGTYLKYMLKYWGLQYVSALHMALLINITPLWAIFYEHVHFGNPFKKREIVGSVFVIVASVLFFISNECTIAYIFCLDRLLPSCAIIIAVAAHAYGVSCTKKLVVMHDFDPFVLSALSNLGTAFCAFLTGFFLHVSFEIQQKSIFIPYFCLLILISNILGKTFHTMLFKKHSMTELALAENFSPVFVAGYSYFLLGQTIILQQWLAIFLMIFGLGVVRRK